jgi:transporter family-2 protein
MRSYGLLAMWTLLAGAGIPLVGTLNSGVARAVGNPFAATMAMFAIAMAAAAAITLPVHGAPTLAQLKSAPLSGYGAGLIMAFYALSATIIIPRMGAASFIAFILIAQIVTAAVIDQFGLFGLPRRPVDVVKLAGVAAIIGGIVAMEVSNLRGRQ